MSTHTSGFVGSIRRGVGGIVKTAAVVTLGVLLGVIASIAVDRARTVISLAEALERTVLIARKVPGPRGSPSPQRLFPPKRPRLSARGGGTLYTRTRLPPGLGYDHVLALAADCQGSRILPVA